METRMSEEITLTNSAEEQNLHKSITIGQFEEEKLDNANLNTDRTS